ncbi:hypothetical protein BJ742DRAFT_830638 [Cladochytrium replicatum]|nr:hypothetical protein BJ742DRAFT_830638 [Cladochytrium replicatum]
MVLQTMSNPGRRRLREAKNVSEPVLASTFQVSYKVHDVKTFSKSKREEYVSNKEKASRAGEWWGQSIEKGALVRSCYKESYPEHSTREILASYMMIPTAGTSNLPLNNPGGGYNFPSWIQYRMKKQVVDDSKHYDILTGKELVQKPSGVFDPNRRANRVSIDKLNAKLSLTRNYDIISNTPYNVNTIHANNDFGAGVAPETSAAGNANTTTTLPPIKT